ncbi:MAG: hypothetical protein RIQ70_1505, partial [Bacteroidota bacterium]
VVNANGLSATVTNQNTTPSITLSTSVSGMLKGSAGSISPATASDVITTLGATSTPTANTSVLWDTYKNLKANNLINSVTSTFTSVTSLTLTATSTGIQRFTGITAFQTVVLPNATTLNNGTEYCFQNESTGVLNILLNNLNTLTTISAQSDKSVTLIDNTFANGTWHIGEVAVMVGDSGSGGTKGLVPAPASGDSTAGKFLKADGSWAVPAGGGGTVTIPKFSKTITGCGNRGIIFIYGENLYQMGYGLWGTPFSLSTDSNNQRPSVCVIKTPDVPISGWSDVVYAGRDAIALTNDGRVFQWGYNAGFYFLKDVVFLDGASISKIYGVEQRDDNFIFITWYAISSTGQLYAWGNNTFGQIGNGTTTASATPVAILSGVAISQVAVSGNRQIHVAAISVAGQLYTWGNSGTNPGANALGNGLPAATVSTPYLVPGFSNVIHVACSGMINLTTNLSTNFTRIIRSDGSSWAAGSNINGQLATGTTTNSTVFVRESLNKTNLVSSYAFQTYGATGGGVSVVIDNAGYLYMSGINTNSCFGDGIVASSNHLTFNNTAQLQLAGFQGKMLKGPAGISPKVIITGSLSGSTYPSTAYVLDNTGELWVCGSNAQGQVPIGVLNTVQTAFIQPYRNTNGKRIVDIMTSGGELTLDIGIFIILEDGKMMSAGKNDSGALGNENVPSARPYPGFRYININ